MSPYAPRVITVQVPVDKIGEVIGPKGKMINQIQDDTGAADLHRGRRHRLHRRRRRPLGRGRAHDGQRDRQPADARGRRALPRHRREDDDASARSSRSPRARTACCTSRRCARWSAASASTPSRTSSAWARRSRSRSARSTRGASSRWSVVLRTARRGPVRRAAESAEAPAGADAMTCPPGDVTARRTPPGRPSPEPPIDRAGREALVRRTRPARRRARAHRADAGPALGDARAAGSASARATRPAGTTAPRTSSSTCCSRARPGAARSTSPRPSTPSAARRTR